MNGRRFLLPFDHNHGMRPVTSGLKGDNGSLQRVLRNLVLACSITFTDAGEGSPLRQSVTRSRRSGTASTRFRLSESFHHRCRLGPSFDPLDHAGLHVVME